MKTIFKYNLNENSVHLPKNFHVLCVQLQINKPVMWIVVDSEAVTEEWLIKINCTGEDITKETGVYIGTFQQDWFVGHVYLRKL